MLLTVSVQILHIESAVQIFQAQYSVVSVSTGVLLSLFKGVTLSMAEHRPQEYHIPARSVKNFSGVSLGISMVSRHVRRTLCASWSRGWTEYRS